MAFPLIKIKNLTTCFGDHVIHKKLNLEIRGQEILGIVGGSGSGKSVLLRFLIGLEKPHRGTVQYLTDPPYPAEQIGVLFQSGALISSLTTLQNVMIPLVEVAQLSKSLSEEIALMKIKMVGLDQAAVYKYPSELSGGMIKRVALARAIALGPEILFLDEPTSGLDPISAAKFDQLIKRLQKVLKMTVVMVTHDLDSLVATCDRIAVLIDKQVQVGTLKEITALDHPWIQSYFHGVRGNRFFRKSDV